MWQGKRKGRKSDEFHKVTHTKFHSCSAIIIIVNDGNFLASAVIIILTGFTTRKLKFF